ncbi:MAG: ribonuclease P protein component [Oscillospiraceae bacterium]|nr:ribonuclease P protein component [Oscillospiraceae bacterium]
MNSRFTLKQNSDFRRLYAKGKTSANRYLVLYCRRNGRGVNRMGYTVSSKLGGAVVRNRVRRRLREIARLNMPGLKSGWDVVVVARTRAVAASYAELDRAFKDACAALGLVREEKT